MIIWFCASKPIVRSGNIYIPADILNGVLHVLVNLIWMYPHLIQIIFVLLFTINSYRLLTWKTTKLEGKEAEKADNRKQICYLCIHKVILVTINSSFAKLSVFATEVCSPQENNSVRKCFQERIFWVLSSRNTLSIGVEITSLHQEIKIMEKTSDEYQHYLSKSSKYHKTEK